MALHQLSDIERCALLGAILSGEPAEQRLRQLGSPHCRSAYAELRRYDRDQRLAVTRQLMTQALSPLPAGIDRVHPSWIAQILERESAPVAALMLGVLPPSVSKQLKPAPSGSAEVSPTLRWRLCQRLFGALRPMVLIDGDELLDWSAERISDALIHFGCLSVASIARRAGPPAIEQTAARLGEPYGERMRRAVERPPSWARYYPLSLPETGQDRTARQLLLQVGCHAFGAEVGRATYQVVAQRLPVQHLASRFLPDLGVGGPEDSSAAMLIAAERWATKVSD